MGGPSRNFYGGGWGLFDNDGNVLPGGSYEPLECVRSQGRWIEPALLHLGGADGVRERTMNTCAVLALQVADRGCRRCGDPLGGAWCTHRKACTGTRCTVQA